MARRFAKGWMAVALSALVLASWLGVGTAVAQGVTVAITPPTQTVAPGGEFDIELRVTQAGSSFNGFDATLTYDVAALTLLGMSPVSLQQGTLMTDACGNTFHRFRPGAGVDTVTDILLCAGMSLTGPGQIYKLHFRASNTPQVTLIRFMPGKLKFYNGGLFVNPVYSTDAQVGIGMAPTAVGDELTSKGLSLTATPNPSRASVVFTTSHGRSGPESLTVRDVQGRQIRKLALTGRQLIWDGRRGSGEAVPSGAYFATLESGGRSTTIRLSLIR